MLSALLPVSGIIQGIYQSDSAMKLKNKQTLLRFGKTGLRLLTSAALIAAPAGVAGVVLKSVARQPLRGLVLLALEPALRAGMEKLTRHLPWEKHETTAK